MVKREKPLSPRKIAEFCQVNFKTVLRWITDGQLKAHQLPGGSNRVIRKDLITFLQEFKLPIPEELLCSQCKIMIIDDEPDVAEIMRDALTDAGYDYEICTDSFDAGMRVVTSHPRLVVLDLNMPTVDGFEVAKKIKENELTDDIKILVVSGNITEEARQRLDDIGVEGMLDKPFDSETLVSAVSRTLDE